MGFDQQPTAGSNPVEEWMTPLYPTREKPTAVRFGETTVIYWRENGEWIAREFGRPNFMPVTNALRETIEADQEHARRKMDEWV